jgi:hypothetical protein
MDKARLIRTLKKLLNVDDDLSFLDKLTAKELQSLIAHIRDRIDNPRKRPR